MVDKRIDIFKVLKNENKLEKVLVFPAIETENDPYEHTKTKSFLNPVPIDALIRNVSMESLVWKYYGNIPTGSKEILTDKRHKNLLILADKIKIGDNYFKCYKDDSRGFGIIEKQDYIIVVLELKPANA